MSVGGYLVAWTAFAAAVASIACLASRLPEPEPDAIGDWPMLPDELRPRSGKAGGEPSMTPEPLTGQVARHDGADISPLSDGNLPSRLGETQNV